MYKMSSGSSGYNDNSIRLAVQVQKPVNVSELFSPFIVKAVPFAFCRNRFEQRNAFGLFAVALNGVVKMSLTRVSFKEKSLHAKEQKAPKGGKMHNISKVHHIPIFDEKDSLIPQAKANVIESTRLLHSGIV